MPFFLLPSLAMPDWLPSNLKKWRLGREGRSFTVLDYPFDLEDLCLGEIQKENLVPPQLILVNHGIKLPEVNLIRKEAGKQLKGSMGNRISGF